VKKKAIAILLIIVLLAIAVFAIAFLRHSIPRKGSDSELTVSVTSPSIDAVGSRIIPCYSGSLVIKMNDNLPYFDFDNLSAESYDLYSRLDSLGRSGTARACIGSDILPTVQRGSISGIEPSGWNKESDFYNRSHLIGNQLTGNDTPENLITGTSYLNVDGMLPFENKVAMYAANTGNHVLYRVTPLYEGLNFVATAVEMEAYSIEDRGEGICFNVLVYNVQPGYIIDYSDGSFTEDEGNVHRSLPPADPNGSTDDVIITSLPDTEGERNATYILNTNTKRFHYPYCDSVNDMKEKNKEEFYGTRDEAIELGYKPCGVCKP